MLGAAGLDFTIIDCEHGAFGIETAGRLVRACDANGLVPLVRAPSADPVFVGQALDAGAAAVVVPGIVSPEQARALVAASRFAPDGTRGACPCVRAGGHFIRDWRAYVAAQRDLVGVIALVETRAGLDAIEAICAVEGLLALLIGPFDLSVSLGHAGDYLHPEVQAAIDRMMAAAAESGVPVVAPIFNPDPEEARRQRETWVRRGARLFVVGTDKILFADAVSRYTAALTHPHGTI
jgi:4-hydroxy-2-oxoheptanedioate aldolase